MPRFRKVPIVVEAAQYTGGRDGDLFAWLQEGNCDYFWTEEVQAGVLSTPASLRIRTLDGIVEATPGDWIIRGIAGEHYPCREVIFKETYEAVDDEPR